MYFLVKDLQTRMPLLHVRNEHDLNEWPLVHYANKNLTVALSTSVVAPASQITWHDRLGRPLKFSKS